MRASAQWLWGDDGLEGRHVGIAGVGKVGRHSPVRLLEAGAVVTVTDIDTVAVDQLRVAHPERRSRGPWRPWWPARWTSTRPVRSAGALTFEKRVDALRAQVVCGAANNQLARPAVAELLRDKGILYALDYLVNADGVIQVEDERHGFVFERARRRCRRFSPQPSRSSRWLTSTGSPPPSRRTDSPRNGSPGQCHGTRSRPPERWGAA